MKFYIWWATPRDIPRLVRNLLSNPEIFLYSYKQCKFARDLFFRRIRKWDENIENRK